MTEWLCGAHWMSNASFSEEVSPPRCCDLGRPCTCDSSHVFLGGRLHPPVQNDSSLVAAFSIRLPLGHGISGPGDSTKLDELEMVNVSPEGQMWPSGVLGW